MPITELFTARADTYEAIQKQNFYRKIAKELGANHPITLQIQTMIDNAIAYPQIVGFFKRTRI